MNKLCTNNLRKFRFYGIDGLGNLFLDIQISRKKREGENSMSRPVRFLHGAWTIILASLALSCSSGSGGGLEPSPPNPPPPPPTAPLISGKAIPLYPEMGTSNLLVYVRKGTNADSSTVASDGSWTVSSFLLRDELDVERLVDNRGSLRRFYPSLSVIHKEDYTRMDACVLLPTKYTHRAGQFAGQTLDVGLAEVFTIAIGPMGNSSFWKRTGSALQVYHTRTWKQPPVRIAFDHEGTKERISAQDSVVFFSNMEPINHATGRQYVVAASKPDLNVRQTPDGLRWDGILIRKDPMNSGFGIGDDDEGNIGSKGFGFRPDLFRHKHYTIHEMGHMVFGVGHSVWKSIMSPVIDESGPMFTPKDVMYMNLLYDVAEVQRATGTKCGIREADRGRLWMESLRP